MFQDMQSEENFLKIQKIAEIYKKKKAATKVGSFAQFGIFGYIIGFLWIQNRPKTLVYIVHTISNFFALALEKRKMLPRYQQPNVSEN